MKERDRRAGPASHVRRRPVYDRHGELFEALYATQNGARP